MKLQVRLFARAKDLAGADVVTVETADGATVADLRTALGQQHPGLGGLLKVSVLAVNAEFAAATQGLSAADEIALLPPVSGG